MRNICLIFVAITFAIIVNADSVYEAMTVDIPVNGTLEAGKKVTYTITMQNWRFFAEGVKLIVDKAAMGVELGKVKMNCGTTSVEFPVKAGILVTRYNDPTNCEGDTTIEITNTGSASAYFWLMVSDIDKYMYNLEDNVVSSNVFTGYSTWEYAIYRLHVSEDDPHNAVDFLNFTVAYDAFSATTVKAFVGKTLRPEMESSGYPLQKNGNVLWATISRNDPKIFCTNCDLYLFVIVKEANEEVNFFSVKGTVDRGIVHLVRDETYSATVAPDNHGAHFLVDLKALEYDSDVYMGFQKQDCVESALNVDVSLTSFDDGEWDTIKSTTLNTNALREWGIRREEKGFHVGATYYIRVISPANVTTSCHFTIVYRLTMVPAVSMYKGKSSRYVSRPDKVSIAYYKVKIPKEEFVDIQSLTFNLTDLYYSFNPGPVYPLGFNMYFGPSSNVKMINNPQDPTTYTYGEYYGYRKEIVITITENQQGWCTDCIFGISMRTTNETKWTITTELGYAAFMIEPNKPREGTLVAFTGGFETYLYLHQTSYKPVTITVKKNKEDAPDVDLFIATYKHPDINNHQWYDNTVGDQSADVVLEESYPDYCTDCYYYLGVYFHDAEKEDDDTPITITFNCPENVCKVCSKGFDPATDCKQCLPGYFGKDCNQCKDCNHGKCDDGTSGSGTCKCDDGWGPDDTCNTCAAGYYGTECMPCLSCNDHGKCEDGLMGTGKCNCDGNFDSDIRCKDCKGGFFGITCSEMCPAVEEAICASHGTCDYGTRGSGRCTCNSGYVGLKCDTTYANDKCNPHCVAKNGGCDETQGKCICYSSEYTGADCGTTVIPKPNNIWQILTIALFCILIVIAVYFIFRTTKEKKGRSGKKRTNDKDALLSNGSDIYNV